MAVLDHTLIDLFDLICPERGTQTHLSRSPSAPSLVPCAVWEGWKHPCTRGRAMKREKWDHCSFSGMEESSPAHLLCVRTCRTLQINLLSPKNYPVRAAVSKWIILWKLIAGIVFLSSLTLPLNQMAPNPPASQELSASFWQGWKGIKINPKAEPSPPV